ncbi:hypothetical protein BOX15_Mlig023188g1 [Macrostomum lignano]|uniref:AAA+ ATPase domain-containing protein n=3 Tax=Macrostomum lignano TaxID=282301 RepID=A0A267F853_9PLAT|nr:hypothetical protein BOX15_Mlig023188g1 [Macrostomum lignano]
MDDEEFDRLLEDELELLREMEEADVAIAASSSASAKETTAEAGGQRKRPIESVDPSSSSSTCLSNSIEQQQTVKRPRIDPISEALPQQQNSNSLLPEQSPPKSIQKPAEPAWRYHRTVPTVGKEFCSVTGSQGQRIYLSIRDAAAFDNFLDDSADQSIGAAKRTLEGYSLLGKKGGELRDQAVAENRRRQQRLNAWRAAATATAAADRSTKSSATPTELWVSKYSPKSYMDLLSDEATNRALLHWLKSWDHSVFGRPRRQSVIPAAAAVAVGEDDDNGDGRQQRRQQFKQQEAEARENQPPEYDESGRPYFKVALLWGPPGRGKTTLAHTAARQCGYNVVEMNASDDRSVDQFRVRLDAVARSRGSVRLGGVGGDGDGSPSLVPGCLVLDEIDGAPAPAVDALVACLKAAPKKRGNQRPLMRPVICVCNDPFVPALRHLRPLALQLRLPDPPQAGLVNRLLEVCRAEGLPGDRLAVAGLATRHGGDLRSCLQALQFMGEAGPDASHSVVGLRDTGESLMSILGRLFSRQPLDSSVLAACSESDERLAECLHHNYPLAARDTKRAAAVADWLRFHDILGAVCFSGRQNDAFALAKYAPFALLACRHQLAGRRAPRLSLPPPELRGLALQQLQSQRAGIAKGVQTDLPPACRIGRDCLVLDLAPCLLDILQPSLRPVSTHLYTAKERRDLATLVDCMICYGLHYTQQRLPDGQMQFALEPPLDQLVRFSEPPAAAPPAATTTTSTTSTSAGRRPPLSGAVKQLVARELQAERLRRADAAAAARLGPSAPTSASTTGASAPAKSTSTPERRRLADTVRGLAPSAAATASAAASASAPAPVVRDFFGRPISTPAAAAAAAPAAAEKLSTSAASAGPKSLLNDRIWFRFNEGFSNAVRRPVRVRTFHNLLDAYQKSGS